MTRWERGKNCMTFSVDGWVVTAWDDGGIQVTAPIPGWDVYVDSYSINIRGEKCSNNVVVPAPVPVPWDVIYAIQEVYKASRGHS